MTQIVARSLRQLSFLFIWPYLLQILSNFYRASAYWYWYSSYVCLSSSHGSPIILVLWVSLTHWRNYDRVTSCWHDFVISDATVKQVTLNVTYMDKINIVSSEVVLKVSSVIKEDAHARSLPRHWSIASTKIDPSRPHQTWRGRRFNSSTLWICLQETLSFVTVPFWIM